jgi:transcriptional regulator with XRE-family HTH domain
MESGIGPPYSEVIYPDQEAGKLEPLSDFAARLRFLRDSRSLSVQEMADATDVPKRTLEKYMLRDNASLPGLEALVKISSGLGVSLDFLVHGSASYSEDVARLVRLCSHAAALKMFTEILADRAKGFEPFAADGRIMGMSVEELAAEVAAAAGRRAEKIAEVGAGRSTLVTVGRAVEADVQSARSARAPEAH